MDSPFLDHVEANKQSFELAQVFRTAFERLIEHEIITEFHITCILLAGAALTFKWSAQAIALYPLFNKLILAWLGVAAAVMAVMGVPGALAMALVTAFVYVSDRWLILPVARAAAGSWEFIGVWAVSALVPFGVVAALGIWDAEHVTAGLNPLGLPQEVQDRVLRATRVIVNGAIFDALWSFLLILSAALRLRFSLSAAKTVLLIAALFICTCSVLWIIGGDRLMVEFARFITAAVWGGFWEE